MNKRKIEKWVWILIYLGMVIGILGLAVQPADASMGLSMTWAGLGLVAVGAALVWFRSRL